MQPRFAALLFVLGLCDLVYVNLGLGPEVFASGPGPEASSPPPRTPPAEKPPAETPPAETPPAEIARVTPPTPPRGEPTGGVLGNEPAPPSTSADVAPGPGPNGTAPVADPSGTPSDSSPSGAAPGASSTKETTRPVPLELASEPAARAAVEAGRAGDTELTQLTADLTVAFPDTASALLTRPAREELLTLAARLRERPTYRLRLVGHADARGTREFNKYLGGRRARAVFELLIAAGVAPEQLELESRGEEEPRATGTSEEVLAANRRVEIRITSERSETP